MSNQSGTGDGYPSQDKTLEKTRREVKQLEEALHREAAEKEKWRKEAERLKKENEKLKKELATIRQPPKWAKANKPENKKKKKLGPKFGHKPNIRKRPENIDETVVVFPEECPHSSHSLSLLGLHIDILPKNKSKRKTVAPTTVPAMKN